MNYFSIISFISFFCFPLSFTPSFPSVALNFQTSCHEMDVHQGRFLQNGLSGYILKPAYLRDGATEFDPITMARGPWLQHKKFHIMVSALIFHVNSLDRRANPV